MRYLRLICMIWLLPALAYAQKEYILKGHIQNTTDSVKAYLTDANRNAIETAYFTKDFVLKGQKAMPGLMALSFDTVPGKRKPTLWLYIEEGVVTINIPQLRNLNKATVTGSRLTMEFHHDLSIPVKTWNERISELSNDFRIAKQQSTDTTKIKREIDEAVKSCFNVPQVYVKKNPGSPLSIIALSMLGNGGAGSPVRVEDLRRLFNSLSDDIRHGVEGVAYGEKLSNLERIDH